MPKLKPRSFSFPGQAQRIAVAVSGGADSMALVHMLAQMHGDVHALSVDHGLRPESGIETRQIGSWLSGFSNVTHTVLRWDGAKPTTGMMDAAREARYRLMADYCRQNGIKYLALGHHRDDQAETFLMRLTHGSGLDGLAAMRVFQPYDDHLVLWRPLLDFGGHEDLKTYCRDVGMQWIEDPTNSNTKYKRNRLRAARAVLDGEGLTAERLHMTTQRLERASEALRILAARLSDRATKNKADDSHAFDLAMLRAEPFELSLRVLRDAFGELGTQDYGPRLERLEEVARDALETGESGRANAWTLGGCVLRVNPRTGTLLIARETAKTLPLAANGL